MLLGMPGNEITSKLWFYKKGKTRSQTERKKTSEEQNQVYGEMPRGSTGEKRQRKTKRKKPKGEMGKMRCKCDILTDPKF